MKVKDLIKTLGILSPELDLVTVIMDRDSAEHARDELERSIERGAEHKLFGRAYDQLNAALSRSVGVKW